MNIDKLDFREWAEIIKKGAWSDLKLEARIEKALRESYKLGYNDCLELQDTDRNDS